MKLIFFALFIINMNEGNHGVAAFMAFLYIVEKDQLCFL